MRKIKVCFIVVLSIILIFLIYLSNYSLSLMHIQKDVELAGVYFSIYSNYMSDTEFENMISDSNAPIEFNTKIRDAFNSLQTSNIALSVNDIEKYFVVEQGDDDSGENNLNIYTVVDKERIPIKELKDMNAISFNDRVIKIVDIYNIFEYNNIESSPIYFFTYENYEVNKNIVTVFYRNQYFDKIVKIEFVHSIFKDISEVRVLYE